MKTQDKQVIHFALCLNNEGYKASLEVGKLYRIITDEQAAAHGLIRIVDESGEDYAFSANRFYPVPLPENVEEALLTSS
ncbi:MAG: hypothetical protein F6K47_03405 [Symploca sp. SIO2E6]|nr:hypothetical protein [Symploca sp. SIO2E6]